MNEYTEQLHQFTEQLHHRNSIHGTGASTPGKGEWCCNCNSDLLVQGRNKNKVWISTNKQHCKFGGEDFPKLVWASMHVKTPTPIVFYVKSCTDRFLAPMLKSRIITFVPQIDRSQLLAPILLLLHACISGYARSIMWPALHSVMMMSMVKLSFQTVMVK